MKIELRAPAEIAKGIVGIQVQKPWVTQTMAENVARIDDVVVCRCERVRDLNYPKALTRTAMGARGGKTCPAPSRRP